jgi:hypothetical protein
MFLVSCKLVKVVLLTNKLTASHTMDRTLLSSKPTEVKNVTPLKPVYVLNDAIPSEKSPDLREEEIVVCPIEEAVELPKETMAVVELPKPARSLKEISRCYREVFLHVLKT